MCFAPTIRRCSPPVPRSSRHYHPNGAGRWSPPAWPARESIQLPTAAPTPIRPSSQPATPCPTYFPRYAPPCTILECRFPFWVRSTEPRRSPFCHIHPIHPPNPPLCFSFHHSHPRKPPAHHRTLHPRAITLPVPPFLLLLLARSCPSFVIPLWLPSVPARHTARFSRFPWRADSANHPYWPNDPLKRPEPGRHKKKMRRRERERRMDTERDRGWERKLMSRSYQVNLREFEGEIGNQPTVSNRNEVLARHLLVRLNRISLASSIRIVAQLQRF